MEAGLTGPSKAPGLFVEKHGRGDTPRQNLGKGYVVTHLSCLFLSTAQVRAHLSTPKTQSHSQELTADLGGRVPGLWCCCLPSGSL